MLNIGYIRSQNALSFYTMPMKKILVTTDFSTNSSSALLFAAQLATQTPLDLTFIYVQNLMKPTVWSDSTFEVYKHEETEKAEQELRAFVNTVYEHTNLPIDSLHYVVADNDSPAKGTMDYALEHGFDYICISTRGASTLKKIVGTNTATLIKHAETPVITVPMHYQAKQIQHILYASDLKNIQTEMQKVVEFAKPLDAKVELLHFNTLSESLDSTEIQATIQKFSDYKVEIHLENSDYVKPLVANIQTAILNAGTDMLVMFTDQNRTFFERVFLSSKAADYSFESTVPMLTFKK